MRQIRIDPCDVLFFRDCRPFSGGEQSVASVRFPPPPLPFAGALRSVMLETLGRDTGKSKDDLLDDPDIVSLVGAPDDPSPLSFLGPFLIREKDEEQEIFLPCPSDVLQVKHRKQYKTTYSMLVPEDKPVLPGVSVNEPGMILRSGEIEGDAESAQGIMLSSEKFVSCLLGDMDESPDDGIISSADFFQKEQRTGIALEPDKRTTQQGMLYSADFVRLNNSGSEEKFSLAMVVNTKDGHEIPLPEHGCLRLGGEGKHAFYRDYPYENQILSDVEDARSEIVDKILETSKFKLCLLSPAIFQKGWMPDSMDSQSLTMTINNQIFRLKGAAVHKSMNIGGWDLKNRCPRPLFKAAPAGSVYFFEADEEVSEETAQAVMDAFFLKSAMKSPNGSNNIPALYRASGLGLSAAGSWDY